MAHLMKNSRCNECGPMGIVIENPLFGAPMPIYKRQITKSLMSKILKCTHTETIADDLFGWRIIIGFTKRPILLMHRHGEARADFMIFTSPPGSIWNTFEKFEPDQLKDFWDLNHRPLRGLKRIERIMANFWMEKVGLTYDYCTRGQAGKYRQIIEEADAFFECVLRGLAPNVTIDDLF